MACGAQALGVCSVAEGNNTVASGDYSHAEGINTLASSIASHAEGYFTQATGPASHAEVYIPRAERPEWVAVGMLGKLLVRDDGSCQAGGLCGPNEKGVATASDKGFYVLKRTRPNQILVLVGKSY
ncbi:peptidase G2 autoproteolytic cleavage domain-containing protein [Paenibacillus alginolyticus]|uniref:peptidase G2 autoproteolytic cleavage domain-containing protein n=1 Tax=Paenibacillus alginolyticus TaxID=59839 RepID=UPI001FECA125|nr:peptidase G2 autoproteolytic cleavage domain-containing protein [Paenibacillus frigoriresistens]